MSVLVLGACSSHSGGTGGDGGTSCAAHATCGQCSADTRCDWCATTDGCIESTAISSCASVASSCEPDAGTPDSGAGGSCVRVGAGSCTDPSTYPYYCGDSCCDSSHPYYCSTTTLCYSTEAAAVAACGSGLCDSCVIQTGGGTDAGPPPAPDAGMHCPTCMPGWNCMRCGATLECLPIDDEC